MDWITNKIYFTDRLLKIVGVFDPVNFHYAVLLRFDNEADEPRAIVLDPTNGFVIIMHVYNLLGFLFPNF